MRLTRGIRNGIRRVNLPDNLLRGCVSSRYGYGGGPINVLHILQIGRTASLGRTALRTVAVGEKIQVVGV